MADLPITFVDYVYGFIIVSCSLLANYIINFKLGGWRSFLKILFTSGCEEGEESGDGPHPQSP